MTRSSQLDPEQAPCDRVIARERRTLARDWLLALVALAMVIGYSLYGHNDGSRAGPDVARVPAAQADAR